MAPADSRFVVRAAAAGHDWDGSWRDGLGVEEFIIEAWSQGFLISALIVMAAVTIANMTRRLLHKLILIELLLAMLHGTFCFLSFDGYGWYVSATATLLYMSYFLHNIIAWIKNKPFFSPRLSQFYLGTLLLVIPYWILETYANFAFNNNINRIFSQTRHFEALFRDPWWIFTCCSLVYNIKKRYHFGLVELCVACPRFGVMLASMSLSIVFLIVDVTFTIANFGGAVGVNPFWKFSLVFKCLCDTIILDDFRSALDRLRTRVFNDGSTPLDRISNPAGKAAVSASKRSDSVSLAQPTRQPSRVLSAKPVAVAVAYSGSNDDNGRYEPHAADTDTSRKAEKRADGIYVSRTIAFEKTGKVLPSLSDVAGHDTSAGAAAARDTSGRSSDGSGPQTGW